MPKITSSQSAAPERTTLIDEVNSSTTYIGIAKLGTNTSDAKWQILRVYTSSGQTSIQYADGDRRFDNIWDDRASLTYQN